MKENKDNHSSTSNNMILITFDQYGISNHPKGFPIILKLDISNH